MERNRSVEIRRGFLSVRDLVTGDPRRIVGLLDSAGSCDFIIVHRCRIAQGQDLPVCHLRNVDPETVVDTQIIRNRGNRSADAGLNDNILIEDQRRTRQMIFNGHILVESH